MFIQIQELIKFQMTADDETVQYLKLCTDVTSFFNTALGS